MSLFFPFHFSCSLPSPEDCCYCTGGDDLAEPLEMDIGSVAPASLTSGLMLSSRLRTLFVFFYCFVLYFNYSFGNFECGRSIVFRCVVIWLNPLREMVVWLLRDIWQAGWF
ncbi:hypothetical protein P167DRAFT_163411 [Morchella conica CCBAS932]|uniref:Uncharacterized protein n=1 Tax=Morchella conica CCBAS932 TaxID=1392247 RepID=A0A3N4KPM2_9PEZI|nr:hypothetical protein P167DRAFT_163411 [Morchella conica CCBAS932]